MDEIKLKPSINMDYKLNDEDYAVYSRMLYELIYQPKIRVYTNKEIMKKLTPDIKSMIFLYVTFKSRKTPDYSKSDLTQEEINQVLESYRVMRIITSFQNSGFTYST